MNQELGDDGNWWLLGVVAVLPWAVLFVLVVWLVFWIFPAGAREKPKDTE
ncbi:MAG: hypothetical protein JWP97_247 [Labilithrix sp.]|nr:hypothetical protein [Labilithrix sp.]